MGECERGASRGKLLELADRNGMESDCGGLLCMWWGSVKECEGVMFRGLELSIFRDCDLQSSLRYSINLFSVSIHSSVSTSELAVSL